ncbi:unnamed protein product [Caenorhabditis nigoni]
MAIPDADKKLSYDCLKCVLQRLEVNFRFRLAERLPEINLTEKAAPLYISRLSITVDGFQLNDTKYKLGVILHAREGPNPEKINSDNRKGGSPRDIDRFGFEKYSLPELTPGDILIQDFDPEIYMDDDDLESVEARVLKSWNILTDLERHKMEIEQASEEELENIPEYQIEEDGVLVEIYQEEDDDLMEIEQELENNLERPVNIEPDQLDRARSREERLEKINKDIRYLKRELEYEELDLQRYQCKRDNLPSPFDMFIQLTTMSPDGTVYIERFNYDKTSHEARKYLICKFLGNRPMVTKIRSLSFWGWLDEGLVVGLPYGIKLDVQEFKTSGNLSEVFQRVEPILEHPNRPFTRLVSDRFRLEDAQNPKVREARVLELSNTTRVEIMELYREITNKKVVINLSRGLFPEEYEMIVENLIDTKGTLGTCYEITQWRHQTAREAMNAIAEHFQNSVERERFVTIPLPQQLQLDVSYEENSTKPDRELWTMKMEVVRSGIN